MYEWKAIYNDGTYLKQYDTKENLFKDINQDKLTDFHLINNETRSIISVFLDIGVFGLNGLILENELSHQNLQYRLIFFNRKRKVLGKGINSSDLFLGFQTIKDGINHKVMLKICEGAISIVKE
jgi:hypothetical protein